MALRFHNPGSAAVDELTKFLAERKAEQQREFINRITMQEQARADASSKRADQQMALQQDSSTRVSPTKFTMT